jgi:hypothetical protein
MWKHFGAAALPSWGLATVFVRYGKGPKGLIAAELKAENAPGPSTH